MSDQGEKVFRTAPLPPEQIRDRIDRLAGLKAPANPSFLEALYMRLEDRVRELEGRGASPAPPPKVHPANGVDVVRLLTEENGRLAHEVNVKREDLTKANQIGRAYHEFFYRIAKHVEGGAPTEINDLRKRTLGLFEDAIEAVKELEAKVAGIV